MSQTPPPNPIQAIRQGMGLTRREFAAALGVSLPSLTQAENGDQESPTIVFSGLERIGFDRDASARDYQAWRLARQQHLLTVIQKMKGSHEKQ